MTTLREEARTSPPLPLPIKRGISGWYDRGFDDALRDYGDYEIVEGQLSCAFGEPPFLRPICDIYVGTHKIGREHDHIKLLVPPREKVKQRPSEREAQLERTLQRLLARLDRHVARVMAANPPPERTNWEEVLLARDTARRALEEEEENEDDCR